MPRSFLVKQHEMKTAETEIHEEVENSNKPTSNQDDAPVPSLPPPLLKVSPRSKSSALSKEIPKLIPMSPTERDYRSIKEEHNGDYYSTMMSLERPWVCTDVYHDYTRHLSYKNPGHGGEYIHNRHEPRLLFHQQSIDKKTIIDPYGSYHVMHHEPIIDRYPHPLYSNIGYYGNTHATLLPKYYVSAMSDSTVVSSYSREVVREDKKIGKDGEAEKLTSAEAVSPDSTQGTQLAVQAARKDEANNSTTQGSEESKPAQQSTAKKYRYTCDVCGKSFSRSNTLTTHKRIHTGDKPFHCEQCGRAFRQPGNLTRHRLTHTAIKPYVCPQCNKAFNRASNLHTHMRTHTNYKPFVCDFCGKGFHQKIDMKIHRYTHTGEKPHKCNKCGRGFKQLTHLTYHMRTHSDERLYKCEYCGKGFNQKGNLQAHIYGHTGERPFKCDICGKGFTLASTLNTHKRTHATKKPFDCQFCGKAFYQKNALKTHYIASHPFANGVSLL